MLRNGRRKSSTSSNAVLAAIVVSNSSVRSPGWLNRSAMFIVQLLDQLAQVRDVGLAELAVLAEVRNQRRDATVEQPFQQSLAFAHHPVLALQHGRIEIATAIPGGCDRALVEQAVEQG